MEERKTEAIKAVVEEIICWEDDDAEINNEMLNTGGREKLLIIEDLKKDLKEAEEIFENFQQPFLEMVGENSEYIKESKAYLAELMGDEKTLKLEITTPSEKCLEEVKVEQRVTKSIKVLDKGAVVDVLVKNGKVEEAVKTFDLKILKGLEEVGIIPEGATKYTENRNVYIRRPAGGVQSSK